MLSKEPTKDVPWTEARVGALTREWEAGLADDSDFTARERMRVSLVCPIQPPYLMSKRVTMFERYRAEGRGGEGFGAFVRRVNA